MSLALPVLLGGFSVLFGAATRARTLTIRFPIGGRRLTSFPFSDHGHPSLVRPSTGCLSDCATCGAPLRLFAKAPCIPTRPASGPPRDMSRATHQGFGPKHLAWRRYRDGGRQWPPLLGIQLNDRLKRIANVSLRLLKTIALGEQFRQHRGRDGVATLRLRNKHQGNAVYHAPDPPTDAERRETNVAFRRSTLLAHQFTCVVGATQRLPQIVPLKGHASPRVELRAEPLAELKRAAEKVGS